MKIYATLAAVTALTFAGTTEAALRTFTIDFGGNTDGKSLSPVGVTLGFSYVDGAFPVVSSGELTSTFSINHSNFPMVDYTLASIQHAFSNDRFNMFFTGSDGSGLQLQFDGVDFQGVPAGSDMPDGTEVNTNVFYTGSAPGNHTIANTTITIGTVAIPEPSAFAFGALALAVTGLGRWLSGTRRRD